MSFILPLAKEEPGSIFEIRTSRGYHYLQCIALDPDHGIPILGVLNRVRSEQAKDLSDIDNVIYSYFVLFAGDGKNLRRIGRLPLSAEQNVFPRFRARGLRRPDGRTAFWFIYNVPLTFNYQRLLDPLVRGRVESLTEAEKELSIADIIGDASLEDKLKSGWLPRDED